LNGLLSIPSHWGRWKRWLAAFVLILCLVLICMVALL
jgi:hypothetical protein